MSADVRGEGSTDESVLCSCICRTPPQGPTSQRRTTNGRSTSSWSGPPDNRRRRQRAPVRPTFLHPTCYREGGGEPLGRMGLFRSTGENKQDGLDEPTGPVNVSGPPADCKHGAGACGHRGGKAQVVSLSSVTRKNGSDLHFLGQSAHAVPCVVAAPRPPLERIRSQLLPAHHVSVQLTRPTCSTRSSTEVAGRSRRCRSSSRSSGARCPS